MSADNGIYVLHTKDGYRVAHTQAIENIYWWDKEKICCNKPKRNSSDKCDNCGTFLEEERADPNPKMLKEYFGRCAVYKTQLEALRVALDLEQKVLESDFPILEYGINSLEFTKISLEGK